MATIAIIGANGKAGRLITREAVRRGHEVTTIIRDASASRGDAQHLLVRDIPSITRDDLRGFDAVACAYGNWRPEPQSFAHAYGHLADVLSGTATQLVIVGGAGSLYADGSRTERLVDTEPFASSPYAPLSSAQRNGLEEIRGRNDVQWTFVSPAASFDADGPRTGHYVQEGDAFTTDAQGNSAISYADYAIAILDVIEHGTNRQEHISVRW